MAKSVVAFELRADGNQAEGSVKSLKAQLKEAQNDVQVLSDKFGATSEQAIKAAQRAAELKDSIGDAKALTDAFNPDRKFQAFSSAIQGVVGGFAALQGAQALFGSESEELEKVLVKVQAAMALSQGINSIMEAKDAFNILGTVIKTNVVGAFSSMKAAIASTGIGLLIVGIGLLVEKFMSMSDAAEEAAKSQEKLNEQIKKSADIGLKAEQSFLDREEKLAIARAKAAGKSEDEIFKIQQDYRGQKLRSQERYYNEIKDADANAAAETLNTIKNGIAEGQIAELENQAKLKKIREDAAKQKSEQLRQQQEQERKEIAAANQSQNDLQKKLQDEITLSLISNERDKAATKLEMDLENAKKEIENGKATTKEKNESIALLEQQYMINLRQMQDKWAEEDIAKIQENAAKQAEENNKKRQKAYEIEQQKIADAKAAADERIKIEQAEADQKRAIQDAQIGVIDAGIGFLKEIAGKNKALQKTAIIAENAMGIAKMVIANNTANIAALATPQAIATGGAAAAPVILANNIKTAIGIASTIAATAKALSAVGGGSAGTAPNQNGPGPNAPLTPQAQTTSLNQGQINQLASATSRAFVLESDVSGNQERIRRINRAARIN